MTTIIYLLIYFGGFVALFVMASLVPATLAKRRLRQRLLRNSRGRLALTYDDGPGPQLTGPLLQLLHQHAARASFFLVGFRVQRFPESVSELISAGHEVGNHSFWHHHSWRTLALPWLAARDVGEGARALSRWLPGGGLFRPPFGKLTTWSWLASRRVGSPLSFWTCDGGDTWPTLPDPRAIADRLAADGGGVVLLHSHDRGEERQRYVLAVTECLLQVAHKNGLRVCTMSEMLNDASDDQTARSPSEKRGSNPQAGQRVGEGVR